MKVLVVKISALGDVVMALPLLDALRRRDPAARVTWVCGAQVEPLLKALAAPPETVAVDEAALLKGGPWARLKALAGLWRRLFLRRFDLVLVGHSDWRFGLPALFCRAGARRSFGPGRRGPLPGRFHGDEYARLALGGDGPREGGARIPVLKVPVPAWMQAELGRGRGGLVALAPGGAKNLLRDDALRRWPLEHYARLAGMFRKKGFRVLLAGSPGDAWTRAAFGGAGVLDFIGRTSLTDLVALLSRCRLLVTHDSGPMHLAALAGVPCLALFGPTQPAEKVAPGGRTEALWGGADLACRPCYDGRNYAACGDNACLRGLSVETVFGKALRMARPGRDS